MSSPAKRVFPALLLLVIPGLLPAQQQSWPVHSMDRPRPPVVAPGPARPPAPPPEDATVLLGSRGLVGWVDDSGSAARWVVRNGVAEVLPGSGAIHTRDSLGSVQLHVEWAAPDPPNGEGQGRGNSGVFLMSHYEIQVLDSYHNDTYPDGQAAAMYGQFPPLVNASRPPGEWQAYDIVFYRPRFAEDGTVLRPARVTVFHNGILVHHDEAFRGWTVHAREAEYQPHPDRLPLLLQDHGDPVRYRNIWVRELPDEP